MRRKARLQAREAHVANTLPPVKLTNKIATEIEGLKRRIQRLNSQTVSVETLDQVRLFERELSQKENQLLMLKTRPFRALQPLELNFTGDE
jgi:hypothetical protein